MKRGKLQELVSFAPEEHFVVRLSNVLNDYRYPAFSSDRVSVPVWGGSLSHEAYDISGMSVELIIESLFDRSGTCLALCSLSSGEDSVVLVPRFSWAEISDFCEEQGAIEEFILADVQAEVIWFFSDSMEYSILSFLNSTVADEICPVSLEDLNAAFQTDARHFDSALKGARRKEHFRTELGI